MAVLHPVRKCVALTPKYVERFRCIGPDCEDNCCTGWTVSIDRKTYNAYRKIEQPELRQRLQNDIKRTRNQQTEATYARIELNPQSRQCPMMEDRLCSIQKHLGEDKLSNTCFSYPRHTIMFKGIFEQSLTLSCPEAARLALLAPDAFDFVQHTVFLRPEMDKELTQTYALGADAANAVRMLGLQLMRTRGLELWQKLAALGVLCEKLDLLIKQGAPLGVEKLVEEFKTLVGQGVVTAALDGLLPDYAVQAGAFAKLWGRKNVDSAADSPQNEVQQAVAAGLGVTPGSGDVDTLLLIERYTKGVQRLPEALAPAPWLLENYLLNEMFRECFPFGLGASAYDQYIRLVTRFGLVRLMLAAQCTNDSALPDVRMLAKTIQVFSRRYQHDAQYAKDVATALNRAGWDTLERVFRFLRT